jgi:hypothetical protein
VAVEVVGSMINERLGSRARGRALLAALLVAGIARLEAEEALRVAFERVALWRKLPVDMGPKVGGEESVDCLVENVLSLVCRSPRAQRDYQLVRTSGSPSVMFTARCMPSSLIGMWP